ncbi:hypothetical protein BDZ89DRAFT_1146830 [Hymenopellis radicata]|nr:hypothetical protein BDZ89DRAFT_1146830 [Hymenopellis radicata]
MTLPSGATIFTIPEDLPKGSIVLMGGGEPKIISQERLFNGIPYRGPLVQCCVACNTTPGKEGTGKPFSVCSACKWAKYCSKTCQKNDWRKHKPNCLQRQAQNARLKAKEETCAKEGRPFYNPLALKAWYRKNHSAVEYAICNVLQLDKGRASPHQINEYAAAFVLERDDSAPNDITKMWLTMVDARPLDIVKRMLPDATFATGLKNNMIFVWLLESDPKLVFSSIVEFHAPPPKEKIVIDENWLWQVRLACAGAKMPEDEDFVEQ